jgi:beta-glucanase (GH16 family)
MVTGKNLRVAALALGVLAAAAPARSVQSGSNPAPWKLVWADEFNDSGPPNPANWTFERGLVRNEEAQWYQPQNAFCVDGHLVIEARREIVRNPRHVSGSTHWPEREEVAAYTSASLSTQGLHQWKYGRFELRAKIDTRAGLWPAWWTLGVTGEWPGNGEIDMLEYYRQMVLANVAWGSSRRWVATWNSVRVPLESFGAGWADRFHVWRMDWDADRITLSVDGHVMNRMVLAGTVEPELRRDPFHQPHYMLLSLAVSGMNGGDPSRTAFPALFEVDYVRVYQRNGK